MTLFNEAFGGGLRNGAGLADVVQKRRDRNTLSQLAEGFGQNQDFNALGTGLVGLGQVGQGLNALDTPHRREQQALQREFQNQQFQATQDQRAFQNDLAIRNFGLKEEAFDRDVADANKPVFGAPREVQFDDGTSGFAQFDQFGNMKRVKGVTTNNSLTKVDAGTHINLVNRLGQVVATEKKNNFQEKFDSASGTATGKAQVEKQFDFPRVQEQANEALSVIDGILTDPNLDKAIGNIDSRVPDLIAGQDVVDFRTKVAQLEGKTFLQAFQSLKGGGQITEAEGRKATAAIARLNQAQSEKAFRAALNDLKSVITTARDRAQRSANSPRLQAGARSNAPQNVGAPVRVASPNGQQGTRENPIGVSSMEEAETLPVGTYITINGRVGVVE